jgi:membrane protease YdiL (CAAX protease family)
VTTAPRFCVSCHAPIPPGSEVCGNCGAYQYAARTGTPLPYPQYSSPTQFPSGLGSYSLQPGQGQQALYVQSIVTLPGIGRNSGFAITSLALGISATILAIIDLLFTGREALLQPAQPTFLGIILLFATFCWAPALIALICGLLAKSKIWRSNGQVQGLDLTYTGITLGSIGLVLPLLGVILFSLSLLP